MKGRNFADRFIINYKEMRENSKGATEMTRKAIAIKQKVKKKIKKKK